MPGNEKDMDEEKVVSATIPSDFKGDNGDYRFTAQQVADYVLDPQASKRVARKYDLRIMPIVALMYLFSAFDRGNVSNAKSDGMDKDLGFVGNEYNIMLSVFYVPYCTFPYVGTVFTKKFGPTTMLPIYMTGWGIMAIVNAGVKDFGGCLVVRLILGCFEGCFGASLYFYLAAFYTREELGKRNAGWYSMVAVSGAFSGLLAFGLFQVHTALKGWQLLFIIEGGATVIMAIVAYIVLSPYPTKAKFLTEEERTVGVMRLLKDASEAVDEEFTWRGYLAPIKEWHSWVWALYCIVYGCANQTASVFLTQIIGRFGKSTVITNLMTVGPYGAATIVLWIVTISSDRHRERTYHIMFANLLVVIGTITLACLPVTAIGPGYFCTFLIACGSFIPSVLFQSFVQNNTTTENGRAFRAAMMNFGSNSAGLVSANIFLQQFAPKYTQPLIISASIAAAGIVLLACLRTYMVLDNKRRNKLQGVNWTSKDVPTALLKNGPKDLSYRHFL